MKKVYDERRPNRAAIVAAGGTVGDYINQMIDYHLMRVEEFDKETPPDKKRTKIRNPKSRPFSVAEKEDRLSVADYHWERFFVMKKNLREYDKKRNDLIKVKIAKLREKLAQTEKDEAKNGCQKRKHTGSKARTACSI